jgi:preprotein translocase subunit SecE
MLDKIKLALAGFVIVGGFAGYYLLGDSAAILRVVSVVAGCIVGGVIVMFTTPGRQFFVFSREAVEETKKVVWPTGKETMQTTAVVFGFVVIMALFLWLVDTGLLVGIKALMGRNE